MECDNKYCIYQKNSRCLIEKVTINGLGMCDNCILISLDKDFLETEKERQLQEIESRWIEADG